MKVYGQLVDIQQGYLSCGCQCSERKDQAGRKN